MLRAHKIRWLFLVVALGCLPQGATQAARPAGEIPPPPAAAPAIYLKSRTIAGAQLPVVQAGVRNVPVTSTVRVHGIVQVWAHATDADRVALAAAGITLLDYLPEMAWLASFPPEYLAGAALPAPASRLLRAMLPLQANDKLEPSLRNHGLAAWSLALDGNARVFVQFFRDVTAAERARILARYGAQPLGGQLVSLPRSSLALLPGEDAVQWVENGPPPVGVANSGARSATGVNTVQASDATLIGTGVKVGIWDGGAVFAHSDFGSRLTVVEAGTANSHGTHVAGSIAGSGAGDANAKGMAPGATLYSYDFNGTVPSEMASAITTYGIALANNSWGYGLADPPTAAQCAALRGVYDSNTRSYDQLVRGEYSAGVAAISLLFAAGNDRNSSWPLCQTITAPYANYGTILGPGSTAKNTIVVGAVCDSSASLFASCINSSAAVVGGGADLMSTFSDWGPMADGRIKPDVVAPGVEIWSTDVSGTYTNKQGTSMATPVTTGVAALLYQKWRALNSNVDPTPATIKALLVQTAVDLSSSTLSFLKTGPDYASGYGRIDAVAAVAAISDSLVTRDQVANGAQDVFSFTLASGAPALKVTLVWDDPAATANAATTLVNNVDLQLVGPDGTVYRPYVLNPASPSAAATTGIDSINNVEQVYVAAPGAGVWQAKVTGSSVPSGPQNYALAGSVRLASSASSSVVITESGGSTAVAEGGTGDTYSMVLASAPTATVIVTIVQSSQLTTSPTVLTFTAANYATAQTITVGAVDDSVREGIHTGTLAHTVASADAAFNNISAANVVVTITDNEPATAIRAPADFDGDGKTDVVIFQRETGQWIGRYSASDLQFSQVWGLAKSSDMPLIGDFDGDGKTDFVVYRPEDSVWVQLRSSDRAVVHTTWGIAKSAGGSDVPVPGDYDGDGKTDLAVFRPGTADWLVLQSASGTANVQNWGLAGGGDLPVPGDYDGDRKTDRAVFRPSTAEWFIRNSSSGLVTVQRWGEVEKAEIPLPADYDGDGLTDVAVFRPSTAQWFLYLSGTSNPALKPSVHTWGEPRSMDIPIVGDYDGDGKADRAVFRPLLNELIVKMSAAANVRSTIVGNVIGIEYPLPALDTNADLVPYR